MRTPTEFSCIPHTNQFTTAGMKTLPKIWPENVEVFRIGRWRVDHLDQQMMRRMRNIADKRGSTVEQVMDQALLDFVQRCVADSELETKVIPFRIKGRPRPNSSTRCRHSAHVRPLHEVKGGDQRIARGSIWKANLFAVLEQSRTLHDLLCSNTEKLRVLIRDSQRRRRQLRRAVAQHQAVGVQLRMSSACL